MKPRYILAALALTALAPSLPDRAAAEELTVVYTANSNGKLMNCNCPHDHYGGLSERVTLIGELRRKEGPFLLVDAGNMVDVYGDFTLKASCVARMMNMMDYDAAAAGRNEVYRGIDLIRKGLEKADFPVLSATIADARTGKRAFEPFTTVRVGDATVAVTALCDSSCFVPSDTRTFDYSILPSLREFSRLLPALKTADFIVVLSLMPPGANARLLETFPDIDLVVEGYGNEKYDEPMPAGEGFIVSPGYGGRFVGIVTLETSGGSVTVVRSELIPVLDIPEDKRAHEIVVEYYKKRK